MKKIEGVIKGQELIDTLVEGGTIVACVTDIDKKPHLLVKIGKERIEKDGLGQDAKVKYIYYQIHFGNDFFSESIFYFCNGNAAKSAFKSEVAATRKHQILMKVAEAKEKKGK